MPYCTMSPEIWIYYLSNTSTEPLLLSHPVSVRRKEFHQVQGKHRPACQPWYLLIIAEIHQCSLTRAPCSRPTRVPNRGVSPDTHQPTEHAPLPDYPVLSPSKMSSIHPVLCPSWLLWTLYPSSNPSFSASPWLEQQEIFLHHDSITKQWKSECLDVLLSSFPCEHTELSLSRLTFFSLFWCIHSRAEWEESLRAAGTIPIPHHDPETTHVRDLWCNWAHIADTDLKDHFHEQLAPRMFIVFFLHGDADAGNRASRVTSAHKWKTPGVIYFGTALACWTRCNTLMSACGFREIFLPRNWVKQISGPLRTWNRSSDDKFDKSK